MANIDKSTTFPFTINHSNITKSKYNVLFIQYNPDGTVKARWYLVQVDIWYTLKINSLWTNNVKYYCMFLSEHTNNKHNIDNFFRWLNNRYHCSTCNQIVEIIYGDRILIRPNVNTYSTHLLQWETIIHFLMDGESTLSGPFNFKYVKNLTVYVKR